MEVASGFIHCKSTLYYVVINYTLHRIIFMLWFLELSHLSTSFCPLVLAPFDVFWLNGLLLWLLNSSFSKSTILSTLISWHLTIRKIFLLPHLFIHACIFIHKYKCIYSMGYNYIKYYYYLIIVQTIMDLANRKSFEIASVFFFLTYPLCSHHFWELLAQKDGLISSFPIEV